MQAVHCTKYLQKQETRSERQDYIVQSTKYNVLSTPRSTIWVRTQIPTYSFFDRRSVFDIKKEARLHCTKYEVQCTK